MSQLLPELDPDSRLFYFILFYHSHVCFLSFILFHKIMHGSPSSTGKMGSGLDCFVDAIPHTVVFPAASRWRQTLTSCCSLFLVRLSFCSGNNKCDYYILWLWHVCTYDSFSKINETVFTLYLSPNPLHTYRWFEQRNLNLDSSLHQTRCHWSSDEFVVEFGILQPLLPFIKNGFLTAWWGFSDQ